MGVDRQRLLRLAGWAVNIGLRLLVVAFVIEALQAVDDPRFDGKGLAVRHLVFAGAVLTLSVPAFHLLRRDGGPYPIWLDTLLVSVIAIDMAWNSLGLYEQQWRYDLIPHAYSPFVGYSILRALGMAMLPGMLIVNAGVVLFEVQELVGDWWFATQNVGGAWDTAGDLLAGVFGSVVVPLTWARLRRRQPADPQEVPVPA